MTAAVMRRTYSCTDLANEAEIRARMAEASGIQGSLSPSAPLPKHLCIQDPPALNLGGRTASSVPVTKQEAYEKAQVVKHLIIELLAQQPPAKPGAAPILSAMSGQPQPNLQIQITPPKPQLSSRASALTPIPEQTSPETSPSLEPRSIPLSSSEMTPDYQVNPRMHLIDQSRGELLDTEPPTFRTLGPVDLAFIKKMVEQHKMSEEEAEATFYCRKWADLLGFDLRTI